MSHHCHTAWVGQDIVVYRDDEIIDRVHASDIERVVFIYDGEGETLGQWVCALVELADEHVIFPADTGFAGRVHFERQAFWTERDCVYWVSARHAVLPARHRHGVWFLRSSAPAYGRLPRTELAPLLEAWPLEGPQTWEQRKWQRIERSHPLAGLSPLAVARLPQADGLRA